MSWGATLWVLLGAIVAVGCTKGPGEPCKKGMGECHKDLLCLGSSEPVCTPCSETEDCKKHALCTLKNGKCARTSSEDCQRSDLCRNRGHCELDHRLGMCFGSPGPMEGGCPCGCDHSEAMVDALRASSPADALAEARRSLATIAEREALGYVTDAMVEHRLRLRALERDVAGGHPAATFPLSPAASGLRKARGALPITRGSDLALRSELVAFGATTELVDGREKDLPACFRLWLDLENTSNTALVIERPALAGSVRFDVRRWYVEDDDGAPWSVALGPGERRAVLVIGYIDEPLDPGTSVRASFTLRGATVDAATAALGRWDARAPIQ